MTRLPHHYALIAFLLAAMAPLARSDEAASPEALEFFENKVRPLLVRHCLECHGAEKQESGLRLDAHVALVKGGASGPAIVPGRPEESLLIEAVRYEGLEMPPSGRLNDEAIAALEQWVRLGAPWPKEDVAQPALGDQQYLFGRAADHWAFQPLVKPEVPVVKHADRIRTPVDAFVVARLEQADMKPSPQANRRVLLRRLSFDLIGLPPTEQEIDEFVKDRSPDAYRKVVDRLLDSPHYGERWGRHWLDVARYADTRDYVAAGNDRRYPFAYTYRDWVIDALNRDLPYDEFIRLQLAADLLVDRPDHPDLAALGFVTVGPRYRNNVNDLIADRIDAVSRGMLALAVTCARCHDHKYDPIPTADYYSLHGIFASVDDPEEYPIIDGSRASDELLADYQRARDEKLAELDAYQDGLRESALRDLHARLTDYVVRYYDANVTKKESPRSLISKYKLQETCFTPLYEALERLRTTRTWLRHPVLGAWSTLCRVPDKEFAAQRDAWLAEVESGKQKANPLVVELVRDKQPASFKALLDGYAELLAQAQKARVAASKNAAGSQGVALADPALDEIAQVLHDPAGPFGLPRDAVVRASLLQGNARTTLARYRNAVIEVEATHPGAPHRAMVVQEKPQPVSPVIFLRGDPRRRGDPVPRRFLTVLSGSDASPFSQGSGRLELANAIADPANPLTARVLVNRVWMHHFGKGLVDTPGDFGFRSSPPSHPELLDWLAATFVEQGWSIKQLHRLIVMSHTYRQSSASNPDYAARDPENRLLWRANRRRLDFEPMRDALLAVSGQLDRTIGGRSVPLSSQPFTTRRTIYGFIDRLNLDPVFATFDFASPEASTPERPETVVPQQALFGMNHPFVIEQARALCRLDAVQSAADPEARLRALYGRVYGRQPTLRELNVAKRFIENASADAGAPAGAVWQYGYGPADPAIPAAERFHPLRVWTGNEYQASEEFPSSHPKLGHLRSHASGGTPGRDLDHANIRRWTAPRAGTIEIAGTLTHSRDSGDGIRGQILAGRGEVLGKWQLFNQAAETNVERYRVAAGETIDFVVDCQKNAAADTYSWVVTIRLIDPQAGGAQPAAEWNSRSEFAGPPPPLLTAWEQLAQALLLTNEFLFVD